MKSLVFAISIYLLFIYASVNANDLFVYELESHIKTSDNLSQQINGPSGESSDIGFSSDYSRQTENTLFDIYLNYRYEKFNNAEIQNQQYKNAKITFEYAPVDTGFSLQVANELSQKPKNRFSTSEVNNLRDINVFTISPRYAFILPNKDSFIIRSQYTDVNNKNIEFNGEFIDASKIIKKAEAAYSRRVSQVSLLSFGVRQTVNELDKSTENSSIAYDDDEAFLRYQSSTRINKYQIEYTKSRISDDASFSADRNNVKLQYNRKISGRSELELYVRSGVDADFSTDFLNTQFADASQLTELTSIQKFKSLGFSVSKNALEGTINLRLVKTKYESLQSNDKESRDRILLRYNVLLAKFFEISERNSISVIYQKNKSKFEFVDFDVAENDIERFLIEYQYRLTRALTFSFEYESRKANGNRFSGLQVGGDSNSFIIGIVYQSQGASY